MLNCCLDFEIPHCSIFPFCMHSIDSCQDYYSEQTMSSLSEQRMNSIPNSFLMYSLHSHPSPFTRE